MSKRSQKQLEARRDRMLAIYEEIMWMRRANEGLPPEPRDAISNLINVKNELERSRFPTFPLLQFIVYLELGYKVYGEDAEILHVAAETLCHALIEYKGQGRGEWVEAVKRATEPEQTNFTFSGGQPRTQQPKKRHWWQRKPQEQSEFTEA